MSLYNEEDFRRRVSLTASAAEFSLRTGAKAAAGTFDIFLSHSVRDARVILGLRDWLTSKNLSVYVDWIDDPELDRAAVSHATAARLREQMRNSTSMIYATSRNAKTSRWMPWELGYFDGFKASERVSVMRLDSTSSAKFAGEEYLGLYKQIEQLRVTDGRSLPYAVLPSRKKAEPLSSFGAAAGRYVDMGT
ncbi:hypothetical protein ASD37_18080 [Mycobacterium sp. Root135]|uniref:TIR domain-containing protein n=1 Tax=Mycobacterium sp. Root135 TaxID=1736457 RepID=UPI0006FBD2F5|nr:TIR domain-containing protein [Mycobacterium sp. Root135]KQY06215.1 hypothetical protein ASD37_18080 [Mycobacterium sp. Root135]